MESGCLDRRKEVAEVPPAGGGVGSPMSMGVTDCLRRGQFITVVQSESSDGENGAIWDDW